MPVAIVPHHLTAAVTIAAGIQSLVVDAPRSILLLSPDHFAACPTLLCTGNVGVKTDLGATRPDPSILDALRASAMVSDNPGMFQKEHGIHAVTPFITKLLPSTRVTPVAISIRPDWVKDQAAVLALVRQALGSDVTLVISSDFSHYLSLQKSDEADEKTAKALFSKNFEGIGRLENPAQSDCPACLWVAAHIADERGAYNPSVLLHTNSARLLKEETAQSTTSHFSIVFYKNAPLSSDDVSFGGDVTVTRASADTVLDLSSSMQEFWNGDGPRVVNLEGPLQANCSDHPNPFIFCNEAATWGKIRTLATHWSIENNHMLDQHDAGYRGTRSLLDAEQEFPLTTTGTIIGDMQVHALTNTLNPVADAGTADFPGDYQRVINSLQASKNSGVPQVVFVHAGTEYQALTTELEQRYLRSFVDAGADAVIAAHTHVQSDMEMYKGVPIFHGIGNFLFDQFDSVETSTAKAVRVRASDRGIMFETLIDRIR